jgi:hypothetical protein
LLGLSIKKIDFYKRNSYQDTHHFEGIFFSNSWGKPVRTRYYLNLLRKYQCILNSIEKVLNKSSKQTATAINQLAETVHEISRNTTLAATPSQQANEAVVVSLIN